MRLDLPPGFDVAEAVAATEHALGIGPSVEQGTQGTHRDAVALVTLALCVPPAILATWDLAERVGLVGRVRRWLDALRALPGAREAVVTLPGGERRRLGDLDAGEVVDAAVCAAPAGLPEDRDWDVFVVHAGADREPARQLWEALVTAGIETFLDRASLRPGQDWPRHLAAAMARSRVYLVLVSDRWDGAWYAQDEVARAISLCREGAGRAILPVALQSTAWRPHEQPYGLAHLQPVQLAGMADRDRGAAVVEAVRALLAGPSAPRRNGQDVSNHDHETA